MKKTALLVTIFAGAVVLQSCTTEEYYDNHYYDEPSQVLEITDHINVFEDDFTYSATWEFQPPIYNSDNVLVYRFQGNGSWTLVPVTYPLDMMTGDHIKYDYDFTRYDVKVYVSTSFFIDELTNAEYNEFVRSQTFRVVIVPGVFANKADFNDYDQTIKMLGLEGAPVKKLERKK